MSSPPPDDAAHLHGQPDATHGCLSTLVPATFHRAWPSDGDVVPADFGIVWAMAGVDWRIEMDLDGAPLGPGPISSGTWQSFALPTTLTPGSSHTLSRRIFDGDVEAFADQISFTVDASPATTPATPIITGLAMVEDHPQPCGWQPLKGSICEADLIRHGCANPIESFPSYTMEEETNTLLYVVTSNDGSSEVSWAECPALRDVTAWDCPASACVSITAVGRDGRLGPSIEYCEDEGAWVRDDQGETSGADSSTDDTGAVTDREGCSSTHESDLTPMLILILLGVALAARTTRASGRRRPSPLM